MFELAEKSIDKLIEGIKKKVYGKSFRCPVCHLELSYHDVNTKGLVVCPLCGVVIELADVFGHALPVVHGTEIKRYQVKLRMHPLSTHIPIGLLPFSFLLSIVLLVFSLVNPLFNNRCLASFCLSYLPLVNNISMFMLLISVLFSLLTFLTGLWDWYYRYEKRRYRVTNIKIIFSLLFFILGGIAFLLHYSGLIFSPITGLATLEGVNILSISAYFVLMFSNLIIIATLGHLGGLLVFGK